MINELLVNLVNSLLGGGKRTARGNQAYTCPFCHHSKPKLEINFTENKQGHNPWHCWVCNKQGKTLKSLFKQVKATPEQFSELKKLVKTGAEVQEVVIETSLDLPKELKSLVDNSDIVARHARAYLKSRNISIDDIIKYNIGYCDSGRYANMVIIPSYDANGNLNYFTGRSFEKDPYVKYRNPEVSRDIIPFELFINWDSPLVLCEGPFDAIAIKRNAIPLLGKNIQQSLMKKIVTSSVEKIYLALDTDAMKQAIKFAEYFMDQGKEVYLIELEDKDPSDLGFFNFTQLIQKTTPLDQYDLMAKKLQLI